MTNEHLDRLIDDAREGAKEASAAGRFRLMARLESCADELVKLRDARTARDAEMRDERARTEAAESEVARLTARLATAEKAAHEWRERAEGRWEKADVEVAFFEWWIDGAREHTNSAGAWSDFRDRIEAEESGA